MTKKILFVFFMLFCLPCSLLAESTSKNVHVVVALCDNIYQRIVPVPFRLGNGADPANNLYWGRLTA